MRGLGYELAGRVCCVCTDDFERVELPERHATDVREICVVVVCIIEELSCCEDAREQQSVYVEAVDDERRLVALHQLVDVEDGLEEDLAGDLGVESHAPQVRADADRRHVGRVEHADTAPSARVLLLLEGHQLRQHAAQQLDQC